MEEVSFLGWTKQTFTMSCDVCFNLLKPLDHTLILLERTDTFFLCRPFATLWKYLVFISPSRINWSFDRWYHLCYSSHNRCSSCVFDWLFSSISCTYKGRPSTISASSSIMDERHDFSFLRIPFVWRAQPLRMKQIYYSTFGLVCNQGLVLSKPHLPYHKSRHGSATQVCVSHVVLPNRLTRELEHEHTSYSRSFIADLLVSWCFQWKSHFLGFIQLRASLFDHSRLKT